MRRHEKRFNLFKDKHASFMSNTKWIKLIDLFHELLPKENLARGGALSFFDRWFDSVEEKGRVDVGVLCHGRLISRDDILEGGWVRDGAIGGGPCQLKELWEFAIPISERAETFYPTGMSHTLITDLFPEYQDFLIRLDAVAKFPYEVSEVHTERMYGKKGATVRTWKFIVFYAYSRSDSHVFR